MYRWSLIAGRLPGRTANDVKNYWNTHLRKKEISRNIDLKKKEQDVVKVIVIKPKPRTFTNNLTWLSEKPKPTTGKNFEPEDNVSNISQTLMVSESRTKWWESLLDDEKGNEKATCTTNGLDKEPNMDLWAEKIAPEAEGENTFDEDISSCLADFSFDMSFWEFLNAD